MKKKIGLVLSLIVLIGTIAFSLTNTKKELKVKDIPKDKLAVFVKQEDGSYKTVNQIPSIGYTLNTDKSTCSNGATPTWSNNALNLANLTSSNTNCYLYFDDDIATKKLKELGLTANTTTPDFSKVAATDEGIFAAEDGMYGGTSYYWRGAATTNYVKFAGFCWRAIRINGDGSLRLIYAGSTCHQNGTIAAYSIAVVNQTYISSASASYYVGWTWTTDQRTLYGSASNAKTQTETWYNANIIGTNAEKVSDGKFCNDRNTASGYSWSSQPSSTFYYAGYDRSGAKDVSSVTPTLSCSEGDVYTIKVGTITMDEVVVGGGKYGTENRSYYLYNGQSYWTMSPCFWHYGSSSERYAQVFYMYLGGYLGNTRVNATNIGLRPVINLRSDVTFTGNGTIDNPFVVEGAE